MCLIGGYWKHLQNTIYGITLVIIDISVFFKMRSTLYQCINIPNTYTENLNTAISISILQYFYKVIMTNIWIVFKISYTLNLPMLVPLLLFPLGFCGLYQCLVRENRLRNLLHYNNVVKIKLRILFGREPQTFRLEESGLPLRYAYNLFRMVQVLNGKVQITVLSVRVPYNYQNRQFSITINLQRCSL